MRSALRWRAVRHVRTCFVQQQPILRNRRHRGKRAVLHSHAGHWHGVARGGSRVVLRGETRPALLVMRSGARRTGAIGGIAEGWHAAMSFPSVRLHYQASKQASSTLQRQLRRAAIQTCCADSCLVRVCHDKSSLKVDSANPCALSQLPGLPCPFPGRNQPLAFTTLCGRTY